MAFGILEIWVHHNLMISIDIWIVEYDVLSAMAQELA